METSNTTTATASVGVVVPQRAAFREPLLLKCGRAIANYELAYETYGTLNAGRSSGAGGTPWSAPARRWIAAVLWGWG